MGTPRSGFSISYFDILLHYVTNSFGCSVFFNDLDREFLKNSRSGKKSEIFAVVLSKTKIQKIPSKAGFFFTVVFLKQNY